MKIIETYIHGSWPTQVTLSPSIWYIQIANNADRMTGPLPRGLKDLSSLWYFDLQVGKLTGTIPQLPKSLEVLNVRDNRLTGEMPDFINYPELVQLQVSQNRIEHLGKIHDCPKLQAINAYDNRIKEFPSLSNLPKLKTIDLYNNHIASTLPASLSQITALSRLDVHSNKLTSPLPQVGKDLVNLEYADLSSNLFNDDCEKILFFYFLPETITNATTGTHASLYTFAQAHARLCPHTPLSTRPCMRTIAGLNTFTCEGKPAAPLKHALFANNQVGVVHICCIEQLVPIYIAHALGCLSHAHQFSGGCRIRFDFFPNLETFDASNNKLSGGTIPSFWTPQGGTTFKAKLVTIDISGNKFKVEPL